MEAFIEAVRQYPCLWNVSSKDYRNIEKKDAEWKNIVGDLKLAEIKDVKEAKAEWKKLRDNHRDSLKRMKTGKSGQAATNTNTWKYAELMEFLLPYMKNRNRSCNLSSESTQSPHNRDVLEDENTNEESIETSIPINEPINDTITEGGKINTDRTETRKRRADSDLFELITEMEHSHQKRQEERDARRELRNTQQEKHPMDLFLESMAITIKTMPSWMQTRIKRKIFAIVSEAEDQLDNYSVSVTPHHTPSQSAQSPNYESCGYRTPASLQPSALNNYDTL